MCVGTLCSFIRDSTFGIISERIGTDLRGTLYDAVIDKDVSFYDDVRTGEILSRITSDTQAVQDGLTSSTATIIKDVATMVGVVVVLFTYDWRIALLAIAVVIPR